MNRRRATWVSRVVAFASFAWVAVAIAGEPAPFRDLFNGRDFTGWSIEGPPDGIEHPDGRPVWSVQDGEIVCDGRWWSFLRYDQEEFSDFTLRIEFLMGDEANSGVGIRCRPVDRANVNTKPSRSAYEIQLLDDVGEPTSVYSSGSLYRYVAPRHNAMHPAGQWNLLEVTCRGPRIRVVLNGQEIQDYDQATLPETRSKPLKGSVCLQNHASHVRFRNVQIRVDNGEDATMPDAAALESDAFETRRQAMISAACDSYAANPAKPSWKNAALVAAALFEAGRIDEGRTLAHFVLDGLEPGNTINRWYLGGNSGFVVWPGIDLYIRYEHLLGEPLKERFRRIYTSGVFYRRFSTSNHVAMAGVTRYLAVQVWGRDAFKPHPDYADKVYEALSPDQRKQARYPPSQFFSDQDPDAAKFVHELTERAVRQGPGEYASRPYGAENVLPLLTLAECAKDPDLRRKAAIAYEVSLAQLAPVWLRGHLATFSPRSYPDMESQSPRGIASLAWLYWGGVPPVDMGREWALRAATSSYRLPRVMATAGSSRSWPYRHRALLNGWALDHRVTPGYAIFSRSPKHALAVKSRNPFQGQSYPCGVMWEEPDLTRCSQLWITCPAADDNTDQENAPSGLHTHGVTGYEQELLHDDALIWVFRIPRDFRNPYVLGFIPGGARAVINDSATEGRIYLHFGSALIGIAASQKFIWDPKDGIRAPAGKPREGSSEFRIPCESAAVAVEVAPPGEFGDGEAIGQLERFREQLRERTIIECRTGEVSVGSYVDRLGNRLECGFDAEDRVNGEVVDYRNWPVMENPWMRQTSGGDLTIDDGVVKRVYDLGSAAATDSPSDGHGKLFSQGPPARGLPAPGP